MKFKHHETCKICGGPNVDAHRCQPDDVKKQCEKYRSALADVCNDATPDDDNSQGEDPRMTLLSVDVLNEARELLGWDKV